MTNTSRRSAPRPAVNPAAVPLGKQLLDAGKLTEPDIIRIVSVQRESNLRFGEAAIGLGLISEEEIQEALARQFKYAYSPSGSSAFSPLLVAASRPFSPQSEALRALRSQLILRWFNDRRKSIAVTASRAGDGASTLAANLAILFSQMGERTLLIDANFRTSSQHQLFGVCAGAGLSNLLTGRCAANDVVIPIPSFENLSVLFAGADPPNPQELLSQVGFSYLVETAPAAFDIVIIDTPPILQFADAQIVSALVGACVLAVRRHRTRLTDVSEVRQRLEPTGAQMLGAVIFD